MLTTHTNSDDNNQPLGHPIHSSQPHRFNSTKWLTHYKPTTTLNNPQYHFISQPNNPKYQKITIKTSQNSRPITTYLQIQDIEQFKLYGIGGRKEDRSNVKSFEYLDHVQKREDEIVINREEMVRGSEWAKKYQPKAFYQLLTEEVHNRNVLTWLKSWDRVVFGREVPVITAPTPAVKTFSKPFPLNSNYKNPNPTNQPTPRPNFTYQSHQPEYNRSRLVLLSGPPGCGKTTLARTIARHCGYQVMELNASDDRSGKALIEKIESLGKNNSVLNNKPTMIVIDEVDGALEQDGNGIREVLNYIQSGGKSSQKHTQKHSNPPKPTDLPKTQPIHHHHQKHTQIPRPIIFICNDPFVKGLRQLRSKAIVVYFRQVQKEKIVRRLKQITQKQKVYVQNDVLEKIADLSNCDIRSSLSILEYVCRFQRSSGQNPREIVGKLKVSFSKDANQSILQYLSSTMNPPKRTQTKQLINLKEFSYNFSKNQNPSLLLQGLFHNFTQYKHFFIRKMRQSLHIYKLLRWSDILLEQSFKYQAETDHYLMIVFLYYKSFMAQQQARKIQFPSVFFQKMSKLKNNKQIIHQLVSNWPPYLQSTISLSSVIKYYLYVLYFTIQTSSLKDADILDCVSKMITYGIELASRNSPYLFKPEFDSLLMFGQNKLDVLYSNISRTYIEQSYAFAKLKANLIGDVGLADFNKNTEELLSQLNIKCRKRKKNNESVKNSIKYQFIEGSGTQITYDLKFSYFFSS